MTAEELLKLLVDVRYHLGQHAADYHHVTPIDVLHRLGQAIVELTPK